MNNKLIKCISILLIIFLFVCIFINMILINTAQAKEQNTKEYTKGSKILDKYPGYSDLLDNLLKEHPKWTFTILFTGLDWDTVIKNETTKEHGRNLVQSKTGEWICPVCKTKPYDSGWYCASATTVSYYMDPRNSLFEDYIFQFENLKWVDGKFTTAGIEQILDGCDYLLKDNITYTDTNGKTKKINKTYAEVIMEAAKAAGVSPYHLASRIRQEQGTGSKASATATGTYKGYTGYYNFFNVGSSGNGDLTIIQRGLEYAKDKGWTDPEKSIKGGAEFISKEYIQYGQNTLYLQKFDVDDSDGDLYWHQYQQNVSASKTESTSIMQSYREFDPNLDLAYNFVIPVFENMPDARCPMPGTQSIVTQNIEVTDSSIVVYKSKDKNSTKLKTLKKGEKVLRIEVNTEKENGYLWDKVVLSDGTKGYIISDGFKVIADVTNCNQSAIAIEPGNVRNGPGTTGTTTLTTLTVGQRVTIVEKNVYKNVDGYDWSRIVLADGTKGYVVARYLAEVDENGITQTGADIVKVVCDGGLTIRKSPGTSSAILGYADKGDYLTRLEKEVSKANGYVWDKIVTSTGTTGYVARGEQGEEYIVPINSSSSSEPSKDGIKIENDNILCEPSVTVTNILGQMKDATIKNADGKVVTSGNVGTGYTVTNGDVNYTIIKLGDVNGDGKLTPADSTVILRTYVGLEKINESEKSSADTNGDGKLTPADSTVILRAYVGLDKIEI